MEFEVLITTKIFFWGGEGAFGYESV